MTRLPVLSIPLLLFAACSSTQTMSERSDEVATCADFLAQDVGAHMRNVMGAQNMSAVDMIEEHHYFTVGNDLDDLDYWLGQVNECHVGYNDERPDTAELVELATEARRQAAVHRLLSALADNVDDARAEEERYQIAMMALVGQLRASHAVALEDEVDRFICPTPD